MKLMTIFLECAYLMIGQQETFKSEYVPWDHLPKKFYIFICVLLIVYSWKTLEPFRAKVYSIPKYIYLEYSGTKHIDIDLSVFIETQNGEEKNVCNSNYKNMYWNMNQQLAHHSVNGCNINFIGDLLASGTISGPKEGSFGSMLEISWRGTKPVRMPDGSERKFINDGDKVIFKGAASNGNYKVGFGELITEVLPAK